MNTKLIKVALTGLTLSLAGVSFGVTTNIWSNATGDGKWSTAGNWSEGHAPLPAEYAFVSNEVSGAVIDIDAADVSIKALIVGEPSEAVTNSLWFVGKGLTLTEQFTGDNRLNPGGQEIPNKLVPLQVRSRSTVTFDVPVTFGDGTSDSGLWHGATTGQTLTFLKPVSVPGSKTFTIHGNEKAFIDFKAELDHADGLLRECYYPCGKARFYGPVHAKNICKGVDWNNPNWSFMNADMQYEAIQITHGTSFYQGTPGVFKTNTVFDVSGHISMNSYVSDNNFNLGTQPRTVIDRLTTDPKNADVWTNLMGAGNYFGGGVSATASARENKAYGHARLTLRGTADDVSGLALYGAYGGTSVDSIHAPLDLEWDPVGDFKQTLTGRVHYTFGTLTVKRGTLKVAGAASLAYVPRISVLDGGFGATFDLDVTKADALQRVRWIDLQGANARFRIGPNAATPFGADKAIAILDAGAKFVMPAGAAASLMAVVSGGQKVANATYTGGETTDAATHVDWIDGEGTVTVTASEKLASWTASESGAYETDANWAGGVAPGADTTAVLLDKATDAPLAVTVNEAIAAFPTDLFVRNRGTAATTLSIEANVAHDKGDVRIEKGGKVTVKNATYTYTGTFAEQKATVPAADQLANRRNFRVTEGGEWVTDAGGQTLVEYFVGSFLVDGSASLTGRVAAVNGGYFKFLGYTNYPLHLYPCGLLEALDAGRVHLPHYTWTHETMMDLHGGKLNVKDATYGGSSVLGGSIRFGQGEIAFSGVSTNFFDAGASGQVFCPVAAGEKLHIVMSDKCYNWEAGNNDYFYLGGTEGTETVLDYSSTTPGRAIQARIGTGAGKSTLNLTGAGQFSVHSYGLLVGYRNGVCTTKAEGYVNVPTGTKLATGGAYNTDNGWASNGKDLHLGSTIVGFGAGADGDPASRRNAYGEVRVTGGSVTASDGYSLVGVGRGEGLYVQESGTTKFAANTVCQTVVGLAGGLGHVVVSNGTMTTYTLYVGGCPRDKFYYGETWESGSKIPFSTRHDAQGTVTVAGGSLTTGNYPLIVGADGSGTLEMVGSASALTTKSLVLSNATESVARFVPDASNVAPITVTDTLTITDGAKLELDLRQYEGTRMKFKLFTFSGLEGAFAPENVMVIGKDGEVAKDFRVKLTDTTLTLAQDCGCVLLFR